MRRLVKSGRPLKIPHLNQGKTGFSALLDTGVSDFFRNQNELAPEGIYFNQNSRDTISREFLDRIGPDNTFRLSELIIKYPQKLPVNIGDFMNLLLKFKMMPNSDPYFSLSEIVRIAKILKLFDQQSISLLGQDCLHYLDQMSTSQIVHLLHSFSVALNKKSSSDFIQKLALRLDGRLKEINVASLVSLLPAVEKYAFSSMVLSQYVECVKEKSSFLSLQQMVELHEVFRKFPTKMEFTLFLQEKIKQLSDEIDLDTFVLLMTDPNLSNWLDVETICKRCLLIVSFFSPSLESTLKLCEGLQESNTIWNEMNRLQSGPLRVALGNVLYNRLKESQNLEKDLALILESTPSLLNLYVTNSLGGFWKLLVSRMVESASQSQSRSYKVRVFRQLVEYFPIEIDAIDQCSKLIMNECAFLDFELTLTAYETVCTVSVACQFREELKDRLCKQLIMSLNNTEASTSAIESIIRAEWALEAFSPNFHSIFVHQLSQYAVNHMSRPALSSYLVQVASILRRNNFRTNSRLLEILEDSLE